MAPIRRYLRISKYSVLECRIYLENPSDTRWLLDSRDSTSNNSVLRRIFDTIKPLVLPKLREENERALAKKKSHPVKDVLVEDDFEVAMFLRESGTRHSLLTKQKTFGKQGRIKSNSSKLTGAAQAAEVLVESDDDDDDAARGRVNMSNIPEAAGEEERILEAGIIEEEKEETDDKKLQLTTSYDGFSIWGWVLCLLVTRKGHGKNRPGAASGVGGAAGEAVASGQALMEEWIGTQMQAGLDDD